MDSDSGGTPDPSTIDIARLAADLDDTPGAVALGVGELERAGLFERGTGSGGVPVLTHAGEQFLAMRGDICLDALFFLPDVIDDLHARAALLEAGGALVEDFRSAMLEGRGPDHARELVPPAFAAAVDAPMMFSLFAAAVALMARLSAGDPAGCVAEEILAARLIELADSRLRAQADAGAISADAAALAGKALGGVFELLEDDRVLILFELESPAEAQERCPDQRLERWFQPFGGTPATGYLDP
jgi:hypothetical protein